MHLDQKHPPRLAAALFLFLVVFGLFLPAIGNGFVNYDDPDYVTANTPVQGGLSWEGVRWALRTGHAGNWHPVTWLSHMADCQIFGLRPWGHHLTSVLLHAISALLLFLALKLMTGRQWPSLMVAALFGCHPLRVESVAWVAERKDVLSCLFGLLALWAYAKWSAEPPARRGRAAAFYLLALGSFLLSLMSKAMLVSLPFIFLLLDYWPLNRLKPAAGEHSGQALKRRILEKIPFFAAAAAAATVTVVVQKQAGAMLGLIATPLGTRLDNALISYCRYLGKIFYPVKLAAFYPYPGAFPTGHVLAAAALLLGISAAASALRRKHPYVLVGWLWYLGALVPVIGLVQVGTQSMADRYTYFPSIGVLIALVWGAQALAARLRCPAPALAALAAAALLACALLTFRQISYWEDSETLFRHALAVTENNWLAHSDLGYALSKDPGRQLEAIDQYEQMLRITPNYADGYYNLGDVQIALGRPAEASASFRHALRLKADFPAAHNDLGDALLQLHRPQEAAGEYRAALRLQPNYLLARDNLGLALAQAGQLEQAVAEFAAAVRLEPNSFEIRNNLGCALAQLGRIAEARHQFEEALRIKPDDAEASDNLARLNHLPSGH